MIVSGPSAGVGNVGYLVVRRVAVPANAGPAIALANLEQNT